MGMVNETPVISIETAEDVGIVWIVLGGCGFVAILAMAQFSNFTMLWAFSPLLIACFGFLILWYTAMRQNRK